MCNLNSYINNLKHVSDKLHDSSHIQDFEQILADILKLNDPNCIPELIKFLDDETDFDEVMFSIIHTIEFFEDESYVSGVIKSLPDFFIKSPRWASIIHMRILNSQSTLDAFTKEIRTATKSKREAVEKLLEKINLKSERFIDKTSAIFEVL